MIREIYQEPLIKINNEKKQVEIILSEKLNENINQISTKNIILLSKKEVKKILKNQENKNTNQDTQKMDNKKEITNEEKKQKNDIDVDDLEINIQKKYNSIILFLQDMDKFKLSYVDIIINNIFYIDKEIEKLKTLGNKYENISNYIKMYLNMSNILHMFFQTKYNQKKDLQNHYKIINKKFSLQYKKLNNIKLKINIDNHKYELDTYSYFYQDVNICKLNDNDKFLFKDYVNLLNIY